MHKSGPFSGPLLYFLTKIRSEGIVALPVHDAVIVMDEHHLQATKIMKEVFEGKGTQG